MVMRYGEFDVTAPALTGEPFNEAEALGGAVWLWMHSAAHRNAPLHMLSALLLPAIKNRQFILVSEKTKPVFYLSWASLSEDAEKRYLTNAPECMPSADWASGERIWFLDWVAPFGHSLRLRSLLKRRLFPGWCARSLYHRGEEKGLRVKTFRGLAVSAQEARFRLARNSLLPNEEKSARHLEK